MRRILGSGVGPPLPVTLKMRTGWDRQSKNAPAIAKIAGGSSIRRSCMAAAECRYRPHHYETIAR